MNELDLLNDKVESLLKVFQQVQQDLHNANIKIRKLEEENEELKGIIEAKEIAHQEALLIATTNSFSLDQKEVLKQQLDEIIKQIDNNIALL